ncbi:MAG: hypothetical protein FH756_17325 [Firmicutes bacterium]|nr:hypothetical protein [Bacillota bacterium]
MGTGSNRLRYLKIMSKSERLTIEKKCGLVREFAENLIKDFEEKDRSEEETLLSMAQWAKEKGFRDYWFAIDTELQKRYECTSWFWIVRRLINYPYYWK